jgi:hypothetical protein
MKHRFSSVGSIVRSVAFPMVALLVGLLASVPQQCQADTTVTYVLTNLVNDSHLTINGTLIVDTTTGKTEAGSDLYGQTTGGVANLTFSDSIAAGTSVFGGSSPYLTGFFTVAYGRGTLAGPGPVGDSQIITVLGNAGYQGGSADAEWVVPPAVSAPDNGPSSLLALFSLAGLAMMARRFKPVAACC